MSYKSVEVSYDIEIIPGCDGSNPMDPKAVPFRDAALALIEAALDDSGLGTCEGVEMGAGEIVIECEVSDCAAAETAIRDAVIGTPYEAIREITHFEEELDEAV